MATSALSREATLKEILKILQEMGNNDLRESEFVERENEMMLDREKSIVSANSTDTFGMSVVALNVEHISRLTNDLEFKDSTPPRLDKIRTVYMFQDVMIPKSKLSNQFRRKFQHLPEE